VVHLLELLLTFNAAERLSADEALSHVYFADCQHLVDTDSTFTTRRPSGSSVVCQHFRHFSAESEMPSLLFPVGDSHILTSIMASRMAGPISRIHLLTTARAAATATRTLVMLLSCC